MARNRKRPRSHGSGQPDEAPDPIEHATPDVELAEAQLALGRPELSERPSEAELDAAEEATEPAAGALATRQRESVDVHKVGLLERAVGFLRGCWRELQRVQWPDRRQVAQATGVVIGFVIVAGAFLGVASLVSQKIVNLILYGHG